MSPRPSSQTISDDRNPDGIDFRNVAGILARRKTWVFGVPLALCAVVLAYLLVAQPSYTGWAQVFVDPRDQYTPKDDPLQNSVPGDGLLLVESQLKIITSNEVLNRVIEQMNLQNDPEFNGERMGLGRLVKALIGLGKTEDRALVTLRNLRKKVATKRVDRSFVIDIMASADTAPRAAALANAVATAYLDEQAGANAAFQRRTSEAISAQLGKLRQEVKRGEEAVAAYKAANNLVGARSRMVSEQQLDEANTQLTNAKTRLADAQARVRLIETIEHGDAGLEAVPEAMQSAAIVQLRGRLADASREEAQLAQIDGPNHPALQGARAQVRDVQAAIQRELKTIARSVRNTYASERTNVQTLQANFDALKTQSQANEKLLVPLRELERKAESSRIVYENFLAKAKTAEERQGIDTTNIRLISRATTPENKSWPPTLIMLAAAIFAGLTIGIALALARDHFERPDRGPEPEAVDEVDPPVAVAVAPVPAPRPVMAQPRTGRLKALSADLLAAPKGHTIVLVQVQRAAWLDDVALQLARTVIAAEMDVMLVDADLARHHTTSRLGFDGAPGLRDVMAGTAAINEVVKLHQPTAMRIVPVGLSAVGNRDPRARQALQSAVQQLRAFDRVIVDGGEIGSTASEFGLYYMADEVVFLAQGPGGKSEDAAILVDLLQLRQVKARIVFVEPDVAVAA
ncbi:Lipopolysaccharide biosynthesis [Rhodopseudomonas palustris HaA2]|uniref:Lipopolysaccharide biosynthesis n=1 Tax=Rhodopseudomonas palustris (strain HaA2) TaxID=316058 RepID=Q2J1E2_RHOP2|nr:exopolysaccharide transport family protein [Rhodopseudomonas palustris]ABD05718.1 Lipopolysaccharide biosynthesis [Rhodopseudomonas palustris HaA2]